MLASDVITRFNLQMDDTSGLSSSEEIALFNRARRRVLEHQDWGFLLRDATGTTSTANQYVSLPSDFSHCPTASNGQGEIGQWLYVGTSREPYRIVPQRDKEAYRGDRNVAYVDRYNGRLAFCGAQASAQSYELPYVSAPPDMAAGDTLSVPPDRFADALYLGMAVDSWVIQQSDKARSYLAENQAMYEDALRRLSAWDAMSATA